MASEDEALREDDGRVLTAGLLFLGAATGGAMGAVFVGALPSLELIGAGAGAVLVAVGTERRHVLVSLVASAAGLILAIGLLVFPGTTWAGLPTSETISTVLDAASRVARDTASQAAPAPPVPSLMLAALVAVWASAHAAHTLAARAGSPVLALLPPAGLVAFAGMVVGEAHPIRDALFLAACFVVLFGTGLHRLRLWGPILPWPGYRRWRLTRGAGRPARRLALTATAVAVLVPGILPGFRGDPLIDLTSGLQGSVGISPIVDIRPNLLRNPAVELFRVRASRPAYWRLMSLDTFDGRVWDSADRTAERGILLPGHSPTESPLVPARRGAVTIRQEFQVSGLVVPWVPVAYAPRSLELDGDIRFDSVRDTIVRVDGTGPGLVYSATSEVMVPSPEQLQRAISPASAQPGSLYTELPRDLPPRIRAIAQELTEGQRTPYHKILAIQDHLRSFTYDEKAEPGYGMNDMLFFLEASQRGYCSQFAGTMAVLLRAIGYPARVAIGFTPGVQDAEGQWRVTTDDTHAWVEVWFPDFGWLAFEPTPTRMNPVAQSYVNPLGPIEGGAGLPGVDEFDRANSDAPRGIRGPIQDPTLTSTPVGEPGPSIVLISLAVGLGLLVLPVLMIPVVRGVIRRRALARARSPRDRARAAFSVLQGIAADVRLGRRPGETLDEYRARLADAVAFRNGDLDLLTAVTARAAYSGVDPTEEEAAAAVRASRTVARELRRKAGPMRRALGAFRPSRPL